MRKSEAVLPTLAPPSWYCPITNHRQANQWEMKMKQVMRRQSMRALYWENLGILVGNHSKTYQPSYLSIFCRNLASLTSLVSFRISTEVKLAWNKVDDNFYHYIQDIHLPAGWE